MQKDFRDLLVLLNEHEVDFMIVGGYALAFHGAPRLTGDIDIYVRPDHDNAERILRALTDFGFGSLGLVVDDFQNQNKVTQLGVPPVRVDIITSITGVTWENASSGKCPGAYGDVPVFYIGKEEFLVNKRSIGRKKDLADVEALEE
jgi:hypothetical protein